MRHLAIIGSGPAGYYTAEAAQKAFGDQVRIDLIDRMPVPYGLIRYGVAPDHQSIKGVSRRFEAIALTHNVRFVGHVMIGRDVSVTELLDCYDAVVLATGAPADRPLAIPGADLPGVIGSAAFVGWYNGHPDFADLAPDLSGEDVVVIGNGNVALDVARLLAKTPAELADSDVTRAARAALAVANTQRITIVGRRGPHQIAMTPKELGELAELARARPVVDPADLPPVEQDEMLEPGQRKAVAHLRAFAHAGEEVDAGLMVRFDFFARPLALCGDARVEAITLMETQIDEQGQAIDTGRRYTLPARLVIHCIGYESTAIPGVPYDERAGRFVNADGRIAPRLYAVGWARRGPNGTIGTNRPDGFATVERIAADWAAESAPFAERRGRQGLDRLIEERGLDIVTFRNWQKIDAAEIARAFTGQPREKYTTIEALLAARH